MYEVLGIFHHLQHKLVENTEKLPEELDGLFNAETFRKTRLYHIDKHNFAFWKDLFSQISLSVRCNVECL